MKTLLVKRRIREDCRIKNIETMCCRYEEKLPLIIKEIVCDTAVTDKDSLSDCEIFELWEENKDKTRYIHRGQYIFPIGQDKLWEMVKKIK